MIRRILLVMLSVAMMIASLSSYSAVAFAQDGDIVALYHRGVNMSCAESGSWNASEYGRNYAYCPETAYKYFSSKGQTIFRLPVLWERLQPQLQGEFDELNLTMIKNSAAWAAKYGGKIILDIHNYGKYQWKDMSTEGGPTLEDFCDLWVRLSDELKGNEGVYAYDLMNEPQIWGTISWEEASQAAVTAIRENGDNTLIWVEGRDWSSAARWASNYSSGPWIDDPADNISYSAHQYFDHDASGTYTWSYGQEVSNYIQAKSTDEYTATEEDFIYSVAVGRVKNFVDWCDKWGVKGNIGEFGAPHRDDSSDFYTSGVDNYPGDYNTKWIKVMNRFMDYMDECRMDTTMWSAGYWWGHTKLNIYPVDQYNSGDYQVDSVMTQKVVALHPTVYGIDDTQPTYFTVNFNSNGGTEVPPQTVLKGKKMTAPPAPVKEGTHFLGWYKGERSRTEWDFENDRVIEDITLYAQWGEPLINKEWSAEQNSAAIIESNGFNNVPALFDRDIEKGAWSDGNSKTWTNYNFTIDLGASYDITEYNLYGGNYLEKSGLYDPYQYDVWAPYENGDHVTRRMPMGWEIYYKNYEDSSWKLLERVTNTASLYTSTTPFTARYVKYVQTANFGNYCEWGSIREFSLHGFLHEGTYIENETVYYKSTTSDLITEGWSESQLKNAVISSGFNNTERLLDGNRQLVAGSNGHSKVWTNYNFTIDLGGTYSINKYELWGGYYLENYPDPYQYDVLGQWEQGDNVSRRMPTGWNIYYKLKASDDWQLLESVTGNKSSLYVSDNSFVARYIKYEQTGNFGYYSEWGGIRDLSLYGSKIPVPVDGAPIEITSVKLIDNAVNLEVLNSSYLPVSSMKLTASVNNLTDSDVSIKAVIAIYNKHNQLVSIKSDTVNLTSESGGDINLPVQITNNAVNDRYTAKVFFWNGDVCRPVAEAYYYGKVN